MRPVRADDKPRFVEGFKLLSRETRYFRFWSAKQRLSDEDLRYLTEVDGESHFALVALALDEDGNELEGVGVTRFIVAPEEEGVAVGAVLVVDQYQRRGVGGLLLDRLLSAAERRGLAIMRCEVLVENRAMQGLLRRWESRLATRREGRIITFDVRLGDRPDPA
jgi:ribosomal protein S18 acetylase RimI-like enzyme